MTPDEERKTLASILDALDPATHRKWAWQAATISGLSLLAIIAIAFWLLANPQLVDTPRVVSLLAALFAGALLGALSTWKLATRNSQYVCKFISEERVRARLAELAS